MRRNSLPATDRRFSRTELLIGPEGVARLQAAKVAVFGLGGVGSYAVEALARAGVGRLVLVDFDDICLTNINRQLHALSDTIGQPKVEVMAERVQRINPQAAVEARREFYSAANGETLLTPDLDYVVDAIDHVPAKVDLILRAKAKGLRLVSSMGAGNRLDPTKFVVTDLSQTHTDPLARAVRQELRRAGIAHGVQVVFSTETPRATAGREWDEKLRREAPGSISFVPAAAGLILASVVVNDLVRDLLPANG
ncbi:MAG: tRNA threonylcarbamoyladenosine dehydratase [Bacillota bacterium]|nr:tRNA threonylcarbamoyladenosine dehydratase [Bacillota bacterium]